MKHGKGLSGSEIPKGGKETHATAKPLGGKKGEVDQMEMKDDRDSIGKVRNVPHIDLYKYPKGQEGANAPGRGIDNAEYA